jgi:hypothetical protein
VIWDYIRISFVPFISKKERSELVPILSPTMPYFSLQKCKKESMILKKKGKKKRRKEEKLLNIARNHSKGKSKVQT